MQPSTDASSQKKLIMITELELNLNCPIESELAIATGVSAGALKEWRDTNLVIGIDFSKGPFGRAKYTPEGVSKVLIWLGLKVPETDELEVTVLKNCLNPRMLICNAADGSELKVLVKSNALFMKGMKMKVRKDLNVYEYRGNMPRSRGKW